MAGKVVLGETRDDMAKQPRTALRGIKSILAHQCVQSALSLCPSRPGWAVQADGPRPPSPAVAGKEGDGRKDHLQAGGHRGRFVCRKMTPLCWRR